MGEKEAGPAPYDSIPRDIQKIWGIGKDVNPTLSPQLGLKKIEKKGLLWPKNSGPKWDFWDGPL